MLTLVWIISIGYKGNCFGFSAKDGFLKDFQGMKLFRIFQKPGFPNFFWKKWSECKPLPCFYSPYNPLIFYHPFIPLAFYGMLPFLFFSRLLISNPGIFSPFRIGLEVFLWKTGCFVKDSF